MLTFLVRCWAYWKSRGLIRSFRGGIGFTLKDLSVFKCDLRFCVSAFLPVMCFWQLWEPVTSTVWLCGAAECETVGMRVSTSESGDSSRCQKMKNGSL